MERRASFFFRGVVEQAGQTRRQPQCALLLSGALVLAQGPFQGQSQPETQFMLGPLAVMRCQLLHGSAPRKMKGDWQ